MIHAIIFDFDGLILDTEGPIFQSWQEAYRQHGQELLLEKWAAVIGTYEESFDPWTHLQKLVGHPLEAQAVLAPRLAREQQLIARQPVLPGVQEYLQDAARLGLKTGLASSSPHRWVAGHLQRLGLMHYFQCIRTRENVRITKPDPELYISAAAGLGVHPEQAIALEDSPNGVLAAKRAGLYCVAVPNSLTRLLPLDQADLRIESLAEIPLERLLAQVNSHRESMS